MMLPSLLPSAPPAPQPALLDAAGPRPLPAASPGGSRAEAAAQVGGRRGEGLRVRRDGKQLGVAVAGGANLLTHHLHQCESRSLSRSLESPK